MSLTEAQARGDMRKLQEKILTEDYESCWGYLPGECWGREASIKNWLSGLGQLRAK